MNMTGYDEIKDVYNKIKDVLDFDKIRLPDNLSDFLAEMSEVETSRLAREKRGHGEESKEPFKDNLKLQVYDLIRAAIIAQRKAQRKKGERLRVLLLDNYLDRELTNIDSRYKNYLKDETLKLSEAIRKIFKFIGAELYVREKNSKDQREFEKLFKELQEAYAKGDKLQINKCRYLSSEKKGQEGNEGQVSLDKLDFALVDIYLEEKEIDGIDFVNLFREIRPELPTFILSVHSDYEIIGKSFPRGCDLYVLKNQAFSLPYTYYSYIESLGQLIRFLDNKNDKSLRRSLIGNLRYWQHKRQLLWSGDKCYHMIDHAFAHCRDDWELANEFLVPLLQNGILKDDYELGGGKVSKDELIYAFAIAVWLHDIGHKGNRRYGEPHLIRETHGIISGEYVLSNPDHYGIVEKEEEVKRHNAFYENLSFPLGDQKKPVTEVLAERIRGRRPTITEMIALFCIYHKSNAPLTLRNYYTAVEDGKFVPIDYFKGSNRENEVIPLDAILNGSVGKKDCNEFVEDFLSLVSLFRFVDGIDIKKTRVGDSRESGLKRKLIREDLQYHLKRLEDMAKRIAAHAKGGLAPLYLKNFYLDVREKIEEEKSTQINRLVETLKSSGLQSDGMLSDEYFMLVSYCYFLKTHEGHMDLHAAIEDIKVTYRGGGEFSVVLTTSSSKKELEDKKVFEVGKPKENLYERIIGEKDCYVLKELNAGKEYIKRFIKGVEIRLVNTDGELLETERGKESVRKWP